MYLRGDYILSAIAFTSLVGTRPARQTAASTAVSTTTTTYGFTSASLSASLELTSGSPTPASFHSKDDPDDKFIFDSAYLDIEPESHGELNARFLAPRTLPGNLTACPPLELIFARGTGESVGMGKTGVSLYLELQRYYPNMTAYGVMYDAQGYKGPLFSNPKLIQGAKDIKDRIATWEWFAQRGVCKETKIILGGYSLGSAVLQHTRLTSKEQGRVAAATIFAYPWSLRPLRQKNSHLHYPIPADRVWTKCIPQDPVCNRESILEDGTLAVHSSYKEHVDKAVDFIRSIVEEGEIH